MCDCEALAVWGDFELPIQHVSWGEFRIGLWFEGGDLIILVSTRELMEDGSEWYRYWWRGMGHECG
jgi:hypothetical protein